MDTLFKIDNTKAASTKEHSITETPVITNSGKNNGITKYVNHPATENGGIITYSDTTTTEAIFFQPNSFIGFSHVKKMTPLDTEHWNENCCLFFISALKHQIAGDFDYAHKLNKMDEIEVLLPVVHGKIAFNYMEAFIKEVKAIQLDIITEELQQTIKRYKLVIAS